MNWLDLVLIAVIAVPAWVGMRTGIIGAAIVFVGVVIGWQLAGQLADDAEMRCSTEPSGGKHKTDS